MRQSKLFTKTERNAPKDETAMNAQLLIRGGFIHKEMAGVYAYLPLGLHVLKKIEAIIREEMNAIGGQEILMTTLQNPELWKKTGRWDDTVMDNWFKTKLVAGGEIGIANTHEEPITELLTHSANSYKDFPLAIYQFQTKFRNELRAKSGIMRAREFLMKDLYSFSRSETEFREFYEQCANAYMKIFDRVGIGGKTYRTIAAGGSFTSGLTDEFQTVCEAGEDTIYIDESRKLAINKEVYTDENIASLGFERSKLKEAKSIEVGNIFPLGTRYSEALGLRFKDEGGGEKPIIMGSYGIGLGRLMGTVVETSYDNAGIIWPEAIAPFTVHLIELAAPAVASSRRRGDAVYEDLQKNGISVLYDDRDTGAGEKFADADLIGIPWRLVVSQKTGNQVEVRQRGTSNTELMTIDEIVNKLLGK